MYSPQQQGPNLRALELGQAIAQTVREKRAHDPTLGSIEVQQAFALALSDLKAELGTSGTHAQWLMAGVSLLLAALGAFMAFSFSAP